MKVLALIGTLFALGACATPDQCSENVPCGFGETCTDGVCIAPSCASSAQCDMEQYCSAGKCTPGCAEDADCYPGEACNLDTLECEASDCRNSQLDCDYKEFCNTATGDCYEASGYYCGACADDDDCGGNGNICLGWGSHGDFCGVTCEVESDCPASFTCIQVSDATGNPVGAQCVTYCWLYEDDAAAPPQGMPALPSHIQLGPDDEVCLQEPTE